MKCHFHKFLVFSRFRCTWSGESASSGELAGEGQLGSNGVLRQFLSAPQG